MERNGVPKSRLRGVLKGAEKPPLRLVFWFWMLGRAHRLPEIGPDHLVGPLNTVYCVLSMTLQTQYTVSELRVKG